MVGAKRFLSNRLMLAVGLAVAVLASALPAVAQGAAGVIIDFSNPGVVDVKDLSGNDVDQGKHTGTVRCYDGNCGQKTELRLTSVTIEYKFKDLLTLDQNAERAVVTGTGVISTENGGKAKFAFTAIFQKVGVDSVTVRYEASRPDAAFTLTAPGTFTPVARP